MYEMDQVLLGLSAMDELVNRMVQPRGATWLQSFINSVNTILSTIGTTSTFSRGQLSYVLFVV